MMLSGLPTGIGTMRYALLLMLFSGVAGCAGGSKILKDSPPLVIGKPISTTSDERLQVSLQWLIVRNGPGSWAKNADWDEYLLGVSNLSETDVVITNVHVTDSLDVRSAQGLDRKKLILASRDVVRRYKQDGLRVKAGMTGGAMAAAGVGVLAIGTVAAGQMLAAATVSSVVAASATVATAVVAAPILVVGGIFRASNNAAMAKEISNRNTLLPRTVLVGETVDLDVFFPLAPSPQRVEISYLVGDEPHVLAVDTHLLFDGLHLPD